MVIKAKGGKSRMDVLELQKVKRDFIKGKSQ